MNEVKSTTVQEVASDVMPVNMTDKTSRLVEYTGDHAMVINGASSGTTYYFKYKGDVLEVDYYDSLAMMAERDLRIVKAN